MEKKLEMRGILPKLRMVMLEDGPGTVEELAADLSDYTRRAVQIGVWCLTYRGQAKASGSVPRSDTAPIASMKTRKVYQLTGHGEFLARRDRRLHQAG